MHGSDLYFTMSRRPKMEVDRLNVKPPIWFIHRETQTRMSCQNRIFKAEGTLNQPNKQNPDYFYSGTTPL